MLYDAQVVAEYQDLDLSGATTEARPGFQRMMADAGTGKWDTVVVYTFDRFARNTRDFHNSLHELEAAGCSLVSITQNFDSTTPAGRLFMSFLASMAEYERALITERTRSARRQAFEQEGRWWGGTPPFGYQWDREKKEFTFDPERADVVREMFRMAASGDGTHRIHKWLIAQGVKSSRGHTVWKQRAIQEILTSPFYLGHLTMKGKTVTGHHPALIDEATYYTAGRLIAERSEKQRKRGPKEKWLFAERMRCGSCGCFYVVRWRGAKATNARYLICDHRGIGVCKNPHIDLDSFEAAFAAKLAALFNSDEYFADLAARLSAVRGDKRQRRDKEMAHIKAELSRLDRETGRLLSDAIATVFDPEEIKAKHAELQQMKKEYLMRKVAIEAEADAEAAGYSEVEALRRDLALLTRWDDLTHDEKRAVILKTTKRITVKADHVEIDLALPIALRGETSILTIEPSRVTRQGTMYFAG